MKAKRTLVSLILGLVLLVSLIPIPALAADSGSTSGSFETGNSDPTVDAVALYESDETTTATAMSPQTEYAVKVTATDANTLDDISTVTVTIFYDLDGTYDPGDVPTGGNVQTAAILTCTVDTTPTWQIDAVSGAGSWAIVGASCKQPTLTESTGDFWFHFKPGKVATETTGAAKWHVYAKADDLGGTPGTNYQSNRSMSWYGEISINTADVSWGTVSPGSDFSSNSQTGISVTYIANGAYDEQVSAGSSWTGSPSGTATLNAGGTPGANQFSLEADDTATLSSAALVTASPTYTTIDDTGVLTGESGDTVTTNTLWLKLGTPFNDASYSGNIYFKIIDGA
jgi:hypothetical protein